MRQSATLYYDIINRRITVKDGSINDTKNKIFPCDRFRENFIRVLDVTEKNNWEEIILRVKWET